MGPQRNGGGTPHRHARAAERGPRPARPRNPGGRGSPVQEKLDGAGAKLAGLGGEAAGWGRTMAALLKGGPALEAEIGKMGRPAPAIPPGMPIGGETDWFGNRSRNRRAARQNLAPRLCHQASAQTG
jgi:hypothetical protein